MKNFCIDNNILYGTKPIFDYAASMDESDMVTAALLTDSAAVIQPGIKPTACSMGNTLPKEPNKYLNKPSLYEPRTNQFWNDEYISTYVLYSHLNPDIGMAGRKPEFIVQSVDWITSVGLPS